MTSLQSPPGSVAYLLKRYPRLSETFILHEILELERQGVALQIFSILNPTEAVVHAEVARVRAEVRYLPAGWRAIAPFLRAHLALLKRDPRRYLSAVGHVLSRRRRHLATIKHFLRAGWLVLELERAGVTHLHAHFAHGPASVAHFVTLLTGLPYSFTAHAKDIYTSPPDVLAIKMEAARFVVTCTEYNARYLAGLVPNGKTVSIHPIYHGVDLRRFSPADDGDLDPLSDEVSPTILSVGRLVEKKGFPDLIEACRLLALRGRDFRLCIVGGGDMKERLCQQIVAAGLDQRVVLMEPRPQEKLIALYRAATIFALPCVVADNGDRDGIPNVLVEAMSVGLPVVSTTVSGIPELIVDGETGVLVPPRDAAALANALERLLDDPASRRRLAATASRWVRGEFDQAVNAAKLRGLLLGGEGPAPVTGAVDVAPARSRG